MGQKPCKHIAAQTCFPHLWTQDELVEELQRDVGTVLWAKGPHSRSNWLPIGSQQRLQLCVGGWPFQLPEAYGIIVGETPEEGQAKLKSILRSGITTFVNLTQTNERFIQGEEYGYKIWAPRALAIAENLHGTRGTNLNFDLACEIPDEGTATDEKFTELLRQILSELTNPEQVLYVHCYGGHGRSGTVACSLLCLLYPMLQYIPENIKSLWTTNPSLPGATPSRFGLSELQVSSLQRVVALAIWESVRGAVAVFNRFHAEREDEHGGGSSRFPHSIEQLAQVIRVAEGRNGFRALPRIGEIPELVVCPSPRTPPTTPPMRPRTPPL